MQDIAPGGGLVAQFYNMLQTPQVVANVRCFLAAFHEKSAMGGGRPAC